LSYGSRLTADFMALKKVWFHFWKVRVNFFAKKTNRRGAENAENKFP
jgi:hypothetical protein